MNYEVSLEGESFCCQEVIFLTRSLMLSHCLVIQNTIKIRSHQNFIRAKCYSIVTEEEQKLAAAGVKSNKQRTLKHHMFVETLANSLTCYVEQKTIRAKLHTLYTQKQRRIALSAIDIKRYCLPNGVETVPYGYFT